jgi:hypothetical protein
MENNINTFEDKFNETTQAEDCMSKCIRDTVKAMTDNGATDVSYRVESSGSKKELTINVKY